LDSRYGARLPLTVGPLIAAAAFVLFALTSVGGSYWKSYFLAIVVLGSGMTVTVAPLTTVVMNSVSQDRAGTASGINNAVARVAGVLAIAVLGVVMVSTFGSRLDQGLMRLNLPRAVVRQIDNEKIKLAGMELPEQMNPAERESVRDAVASAFVSGFRVVMFICACLAGVSAAITWKLIPKGKLQSRATTVTERSAA
jgi:predicted MFS family arabinose efflux permease